ncbi:GxxExxY protein [Prevotella scopos JCM 17725]|uniref:GxxExxY protein n=1 Tax=Prevotella scopos JCM 17725 TaxID=1236518 RepID=A0AAX2F6A2_9BACT|nr:GxxExxY protein [Prevotella scopos]ANR72493.1 GxxExxY protein [Prevotella scopos JCM 17725]QUB45295.1 GxxExxY protein [Prevotella scopos JCM 17725]SHG01544.1 GxxExxY protein [Prevotella scopos JCM 17725]
MNTEEVIKLIINKAYEVRSHFVAGYLESVYKKALLIELRDAGLKVEDEVEMPVRYKGHIIGDFRADIVVEGCVIIELKAVAQLLPAHAIQLVNYLSVAGVDNGLLINFGAAERLEIKRKYRVYSPHS